MRGVTALDVMVPLDQYPAVLGTCTLREAAAALEASQIEKDGFVSMPRLLLVFDEEKRLQGLVRRRDILRGLEPEFLSELSADHPEALFPVEADPHLSEFLSLNEMAEVERRAERPVTDVMQPAGDLVDAKDSLMVIVHKMARDDDYLLPVCEEGRVVGVVRTVDVLRRVLAAIG